MQQVWSDRIIHYLGTLPIFKGIAVDDLPALLNWLGVTVKSYKAGAIVYKCGDKINSIDIPLQKDYQLGAWPWDEDRNKQYLYPNCLGLTHGFICGSAAAEKLVTKTAIEYLVIPWQVVKWRLVISGRLAWNIQLFLYNVAMINLALAATLEERNSILSLLSMRSKLSKFLLITSVKLGKEKFSLNVNRQELADFLVVSRPTMCRELALMKAEGLINYYLNDFEICDFAALEICAEKTKR